MNIEEDPSFFQNLCDTIRQYICSDASPIESKLQSSVQTALENIMKNGHDPSHDVDESDYDSISDAVVMWCRLNPNPIAYDGDEYGAR